MELYHQGGYSLLGPFDVKVSRDINKILRYSTMIIALNTIGDPYLF